MIIRFKLLKNSQAWINGLLGQKLVYKLKDKTNIQCIATARGENRLVNKTGYEYAALDITNYDNVESVFSKFMPDVIINTAAMTNVDACETDKEGALLLNTTSHFKPGCH